jgi:hypothetical protein
MAGHWTDKFSFVTGAIRNRDLGYLVLSDDKAAERKIPLAGFVQWKPNEWADGGQVKWRVAGAVVVRNPIEQLCAVGEFGDVQFLGSGDKHLEVIGKGKRSPKHRGPLRGVRVVDDRVYVVGMDRQVYRRDGINQWIEMDKGARPTATNDDVVVGFESVDGYSANELYAVGWDGEIWSYSGSVWAQISSPVNVVLLDVCCAGDGMVYACSRNGGLIRGRAGQWEVVDLKGFNDDIWSLAWYKGRLYLASMDNLFTLGIRGLELVDVGTERPSTCYDLVCDAGVLWSVGAKDVIAFDGHRWTRID